MRLTRIHQIAARAGDAAETKSFYSEKLGARFIGAFDPPGIIFYEFNGTRIIFEGEGNPATLYFWVDDIDAAYEALGEQGVEFLGPPHMIHKDDDGSFDNPGTEEWMAFFNDPGGNTLAIATRR